LLHTSCSYCWLSRTFCAALSFPGDCAEAFETEAAIHPATASQAKTVLRIYLLPVSDRDAQSTIVNPPLTLNT
jgi:hypothetical protein